jgi:hypothetical protein
MTVLLHGVELSDVGEWRLELSTQLPLLLFVEVSLLDVAKQNNPSCLMSVLALSLILMLFAWESIFGM